jgi:hypothetical protein
LGSADKKSVTLKLEADPNAPALAPVNAGPEANPGPATQVAAGAAVAPVVAPPPAPAKPPSRAAAYVSWGVGLVGVGVGTAFGVMAMKDKHDLQCTNNTCPPSSQDAVDSAKRKGNISTIAFGVGGAGLVLGTVLYFSIGSGSAEAHASSAPARGFAGLQRGRAMIGPGSVQLAADF